MSALACNVLPPEAISHEQIAYMTRAHLSSGPKVHPRAYKVPPPRKCDGTMLLREHWNDAPKRVPMPAWLLADKSVKRRAPKIHPLSYQQPKPRKDDGTMLWRPAGATEAIRIPTPDNFRVVAIESLDAWWSREAKQITMVKRMERANALAGGA